MPPLLSFTNIDLSASLFSVEEERDQLTVDLVAAQSDSISLRQKLRSREREAEEALVENARAWGAYVDSKDALKDVREIWDMVDGVIRERDAAQKVG